MTPFITSKNPFVIFFQTVLEHIIDHFFAVILKTFTIQNRSAWLAASSHTLNVNDSATFCFFIIFFVKFYFFFFKTFF
ncbi:Uncharacterised protein [Klebsiella pneumoniae]|nr:Uncharacterised protein [Klebsiella pneumoniae]